MRAAASAPEAPDGGSEPGKAVGLRSELLGVGIRALCVAAPLAVFPLAAVAAVTGGGGGGGGRGSRGGGGDDDEGDDFDGEDDDGAEFEESGFEEEEEEEEGSDEEAEDRAPKGRKMEVFNIIHSNLVIKYMYHLVLYIISDRCDPPL